MTGQPNAASDFEVNDVVGDMIDSNASDPNDAGANGAWLMRILSGPHVGAELSIRQGRYTIGTDAACDIVLSGGGLAAQHAVVIRGDGSTSIEPGDGSVVVDGAQIDGSVVLDDFQPVLVGSTVFAFGPAGTTWPDIDLPSLESEAPISRDITPVQADDSPAVAEAQTGEVADDVTAASASSAAAAVDRGDERGRRRPWLVMTVLLALILTAVVFGAYFWVSMRGSIEEQTADLPNLRERVLTIITGLDFGAELTVSTPAGPQDNRVVVQGYLDTEEQRRELLASLQPLIGGITVRVWSTALLASSIREVLAGMRIDLDVKSVENGDVVLTGLLPESISGPALKQSLQRDVPGIVSLGLQVVSSEEAEHWLRDQIAEAGLPDQNLSIVRNGGIFTIDGSLPKSMQEAWKKTLSAFTKRYGEQLTVHDDVRIEPAIAEIDVADEATQQAFEFVVRAINVGPPGYITLDNNDKYLVGSRLANGMILEDVRPNGVVLRDGETRHFVEIAKDNGHVARVRQLESE